MWRIIADNSIRLRADKQGLAPQEFLDCVINHIYEEEEEYTLVNTINEFVFALKSLIPKKEEKEKYKRQFY